MSFPNIDGLPAVESCEVIRIDLTPEQFDELLGRHQLLSTAVTIGVAYADPIDVSINGTCWWFTETVVAGWHMLKEQLDECDLRPQRYILLADVPGRMPPSGAPCITYASTALADDDAVETAMDLHAATEMLKLVYG